MSVEKRHVTMVNVTATGLDAEGNVVLQRHEAHDYVPLDLLDAYVADAKTRWQAVSVEDGHNPGPGGDDGVTHYPEHLERKSL